ncbi:hypothetical protein SAMN05428969_1071 [Devosia sp. YR412]|uniref:hypothetical protein n=1 Tax=Devosia sp. YR412 TaxID=1881030 RepID=UPI0008B13D9B|nr:hypothetical protein [Devosia sp. YR412]SEP82439.1 hypothetical protein SAMN05428969_1071 [Devosia sp. YR412]
MPELDWTKDLAAAGGLANTTLYRMAAENPGHADARLVADKLLVIGRVYSAAVTRGAGQRDHLNEQLPRKLYDHLAERLVRVNSTLDGQLAQLNKIDRIDVDNLAAVVECHRFLNGELVQSIKDWQGPNRSREVQARDSFVSKYLHFHAPMAFFILDSLARNALRVDGRSRPVEWPTYFGPELRTPYAAHCLRLLAYIELNYRDQWWTPRMVDGHLLGYLPDER